MTQPTKEQVDEAIAKGGDEWTHDVLAAEVRALREELEQWVFAYSALKMSEQIARADIDRLTVERDFWEDQVVGNPQDTIARIEALPAKWRAYADGLRRNHDEAVIARVRKGCADELEAALEGGE